MRTAARDGGDEEVGGVEVDDCAEGLGWGAEGYVGGVEAVA